MSYTVLSRKPDNPPVYTSQGVLKFCFEEYDAINTGMYIPLKIYDENRSLLEEVSLDGTTLNSSLTPTDYLLGDNKVDLDLSSVSGMTEGEIYMLEVTTYHGEKRYIRFQYSN
jgi:hypothetical protein